MSLETSDNERAWTADKREFVADSRDSAADERDIAADAREAIADAREALANDREARLDERQAQLEASASQIGLALNLMSVAAEQAATLAARTGARQARSESRTDRMGKKVDRDAAALRRLAEGGPTLLALTFASVAEQLFDAETYDEVLTRIAEAAVATVAGGDMASVTLLEGGAYRTAASTDEAATAVDRQQYEAQEGPSLDALSVPLVDAPGFPDHRWPALGAHPTRHGVQSSVSYHLNAMTREDGGTGTGSLTIYAHDAAAFDQAAQDIGLVLAAHASLAARAVGERATLEGLGQNLQQALLSRDVIGQAKGILMERLKVTPEDAFEILRRSSQRLHLKLREVANRITETGEISANVHEQA